MASKCLQKCASAAIAIRDVQTQRASGFHGTESEELLPKMATGNHGKDVREEEPGPCSWECKQVQSFLFLFLEVSMEVLLGNKARSVI